MKYSNYGEIVERFRNKLYSICDSPIYYRNLDICINYYVDKLFDESNVTILGLSKLETIVLRQYFGFNSDKISYNYKEIQNNIKKSHIVEILKGALQRIFEISKNINEILEKEKVQENNLLNILLGNLEISTRTFNALRYIGVYTLGDLICFSKDELLNAKNISNLEVQQIIDNLKIYGLTLKSDGSDDFDINSSSNKKDLELRKLSLKYQRTSLEIKRLELILKDTYDEIVKLLTKDLEQNKFL